MRRRARGGIPGVRIRVVLRPGVAIGPGKADLLERIQETGSIAAAGRGLGMSYTRAWKLVEAMNREFHPPLVARTKGGVTHGGASLTAAGRAVLARYRRLTAAAARAVRKEVAALRRKVA